MTLHHKEIYKHPEHNKLSKSGLIKCTAGAALVASIFFHSPGYSQLMKKPSNEFVEKKDTILIKDNTLPIDSIEYANKVSQLIIEINTYRKSRNLNELQPDSLLNKTAQEYCDYCVKNHRFNGHIDKEGNDPTNRSKKNGYASGYVRENICFGPMSGGENDPKYVVEFRKKLSPLHNDTMLDRTGKKIGASIIKFQNGDSVCYLYIIEIGVSL